MATKRRSNCSPMARIASQTRIAKTSSVDIKNVPLLTNQIMAQAATEGDLSLPTKSNERLSKQLAELILRSGAADKRFSAYFIS